ncbi:flagellar basal body-associated protein FliL [Helicobacter kayseriensis]|uniref:flagellar basal body-associated protein FliL n=1 Tax=Helicobacter kayseriensis TaxID=2905877 RepID=UPI001E4989F9|nr:flagellar basal body-associated protein FliL [Helicobacter kayseriensis]MCE3047682.1 flagellar basal body-associated protein FliL [Helicobacter kayseriensis]MCE3049080.1 flagellar basal body-associated protein FliL [Helicobacter kayseriensis]
MSEEVSTEKKGNKGLLIAIIGFLVVLIVAIVVVVILLLGGEKETEQAPAQKAQKERPKVEERSDYARPGPIFAIPESFVVNLMGQNGRRYAKASISLEMSSPELQKEITAKLPLIKDTIIRTLSSKTFEEISTPKGKDKLKEEITQELNAFMLDGYIKSIFFTEFVIQ